MEGSQTSWTAQILDKGHKRITTTITVMPRDERDISSSLVEQQ